jgi:hypothetical protein
VFFDLWHRLGNGVEALAVATDTAEVETGAAAEVAVLASCPIDSSSLMSVDAAVAESFAALCSVGKGSATATFSDRWSET